MKQSAKVFLVRSPPMRPCSVRRRSSTSPVTLSKPDDERLSTVVLTAVNEPEGSSMARIWPSSRPCGVISPAVEQPA